ncbi:MAG: MATE family efflux transporter [Candidatus Nanohaloarchaea archaeon]
MSFRDLFKSKDEIDLIEGDIRDSLFYLSLPIVMINLLRVAYNLADTFWLGQLSKEALAGITFAFPIIFFLISLGMGLSVAGSVLVAQYEGSGRREDVGFAASQTVTFSLIAALLLGGMGYFIVGDLLQLVGAGPEVLPLATGYLQTISLGLFSMFGFAVFISLMRGFGETVTPMLVMLGSVVLNIVLDPFLIFGWSFFPALGIEGAAIATIFSRFLALLTGLAILFRGKEGLQITLPQMVPDLEFLKKMLRIGIPASIEGTGRSISVNAIVAIVGMFSTSVVAGYGIGIRIFSLIFLPANATARGVSTMTGQNLGADNQERAERTNYVGAKYMFAILSTVGVVVFLAAEPIASVFTNSSEVTAVATQFLRIAALTFGFIGIQRSFVGGFRGAGSTTAAAVISIATLGAIRLPAAFALSRIYGATGIWMAFPISNVAGALIAWLWFRRGSWKEKVVDEKGEVAEELDEYGETVTERFSSKIQELISWFHNTI